MDGGTEGGIRRKQGNTPYDKEKRKEGRKENMIKGKEGRKEGRIDGKMGVRNEGGKISIKEGGNQ